MTCHLPSSSKFTDWLTFYAPLKHWLFTPVLHTTQKWPTVIWQQEERNNALTWIKRDKYMWLVLCFSVFPFFNQTSVVCREFTRRVSPRKGKHQWMDERFQDWWLSPLSCFYLLRFTWKHVISNRENSFLLHKIDFKIMTLFVSQKKGGKLHLKMIQKIKFHEIPSRFICVMSG